MVQMSFFLISFLRSFHELAQFFESRQVISSNLYPYSEILLSEAAIMAYQEKLKIFKMFPAGILTYMVLASFVPNFTLLPHLAQFLHVSVVLETMKFCLFGMPRYALVNNLTLRSFISLRYL